MNPPALALALALSLGQAAPDGGPATAPPDAPPPPARPAPAPAPGPGLRELRLEPLPGGAFRATLDGQPVAGADLYRAALRPDLAERLEGRARARTTALVLAGGAAVGGPALGWIAFRAQGRSVQPCLFPGTSGCEALNAQIRRDNRALGVRGLLVGGAAGAAAAGLALWWRAAHPAFEVDRAEAEALVEAYEARRLGARPASPPDPPTAPGAGETGLRLRLQPLAGGALASVELRR